MICQENNRRLNPLQRHIHRRKICLRWSGFYVIAIELDSVTIK
jgi:hypothetical protein